MTSTSTLSRRGSSISPHLGGQLGQQLPPPYNLDAEEPEQLPSVSGAVKNLIVRHTQELRESVEQLPRIGNSVRKAFREFFVKEATTIFDFLDKPLGENKALSQSYQILKRFGRGEYIGNKNKLRDLILNIDCSETIQEIQNLLQGSSETPFNEWVKNTRIILEQWKKATTEFSVAEKHLQERLQVFDELSKRVQTIILLPPSEGYEGLTKATEVYLKGVFEENKIETIYNEIIQHLKKIVVLTDAMATIRQLLNVSTEPMCSICFEDTVSIVSIPCGHTFCNSCGGKQVNTCYICRVPVRDRVKIYFS
jgi:Zinc finger, C3HC4 type (RING finger)